MTTTARDAVLDVLAPLRTIGGKTTRMAIFDWAHEEAPTAAEMTTLADVILGKLADALEAELTDHPECVHPGAPRSVSRDAVIPVRVVLEMLRGAR